MIGDSVFASDDTRLRTSATITVPPEAWRVSKLPELAMNSCTCAELRGAGTAQAACAKDGATDMSATKPNKTIFKPEPFMMLLLMSGIMFSTQGVVKQLFAPVRVGKCV
jgi:hypothetical protein